LEYEDAIYKYAEILEDDFLEKYNLSKNKQKFLDKNLEKFETEYFELINEEKNKK
jgi:hypothetical protein